MKNAGIGAAGLAAAVALMAASIAPYNNGRMGAPVTEEYAWRHNALFTQGVSIHYNDGKNAIACYDDENDGTIDFILWYDGKNHSTKPGNPGFQNKERQCRELRSRAERSY